MVFYKVAIMDTNECPNVSDDFNFVVGVNDITKGLSYFDVSPNPSSGIFNLEVQLDKPSAFQITISDILGNQMINFTDVYEQGVYHKQIDLQQFAPGIYNVTIKTEVLNKVMKIVKQ